MRLLPDHPPEIDGAAAPLDGRVPVGKCASPQKVAILGPNSGRSQCGRASFLSRSPTRTTPTNGMAVRLMIVGTMAPPGRPT